ncbi:hypothetical protein V8J83_16595 [Gymnodinialimonas sp. 2307UL20-7]
MRQFKNPHPNLALGPYFVFLFFIPGLTGWIIFAMLSESGLRDLIWEGYIPSFLAPGENDTVFSHGAHTFMAGAIGLAVAYWVLGCLCLIPDAFRPPNYQNKRHLWKDWPDA